MGLARSWVSKRGDLEAFELKMLGKALLAYKVEIVLLTAAV